MADTFWIWRDNLDAFLVTLGQLVQCRVDEDDLGAIRVGMTDTNDETDQWFEYEFAGESTLKIRLARCVGGDEVMLVVESPGPASALEGLVAVAQNYAISPRGRR